MLLPWKVWVLSKLVFDSMCLHPVCQPMSCYLMLWGYSSPPHPERQLSLRGPHKHQPSTNPNKMAWLSILLLCCSFQIPVVVMALFTKCAMVCSLVWFPSLRTFPVVLKETFIIQSLLATIASEFWFHWANLQGSNWWKWCSLIVTSLIPVLLGDVTQ